MPPFATAQVFCATRDGPRKWRISDFVFARSITTPEKQVLARVVGIRKENWGQPRIFQFSFFSLGENFNIVLNFKVLVDSLLNCCRIIISKKCMVTSNFLFGFQ